MNGPSRWGGPFHIVRHLTRGAAPYYLPHLEGRYYTTSGINPGIGRCIPTARSWFPGSRTAPVRAGKLSVAGSHASSIDVDGGTLGGSGTVEGNIDVNGGVLQPGLSPEEAERVTDVPVEPGNILNAGGDVNIGRNGRVAETIRSDDDYTSVQAAGDLMLHGGLALDVDGALTRGTVLTVMSGRSITGRFHALPEGRVVPRGRPPFPCLLSRQQRDADCHAPGTLTSQRRWMPHSSRVRSSHCRERDRKGP